jgi:AbrB family looped-hinge helix DNA binding protein
VIGQKQKEVVWMEKIGIKKEIDKLGRICIPKEMRKLFNFENEVEIQVTPEGILIKNPEYVLVKK